ncbi:MAG: hypothetical protein E6K65_15265 [Nitrospirae bacterium]|nr:MAG: hypothetical protein E6K65_15265 [Nitrospirota bacterium]
MIQELIDQVTLLQTHLRHGNSVNVNNQTTKAEVIQLAHAYFQSFRPNLTKALGENDLLLTHDSRWQELVRLAHGNNQRKTYLKTLRDLAIELKEFSVILLARVSERGQEGKGLSSLTPAEQQIIATLEALLPTAAASYRQGVHDVREARRLSYRGTASEFREALRETLDHLAPDKAVMQQPGFSPEEGQKKPTMKQKVRFVMNPREKNKTQREVTEKSVGVIETLTGEVVRATYDRASLATHLETSRGEVLRIKRYVDTVLFDLLEIPDS